MPTHKNQHIVNPYDDTNVFGSIPEIKNKSFHIKQGDIVLKYGDHWQTKRGFGGFGLKHILAEHGDELALIGYDGAIGAAQYVADIATVGAKIFNEFGSMRNERLSVIKSKLGMVVVEQQYDGHNNVYYSVVTAFKNSRSHGQLVGSIKTKRSETN